MAATSNRFDPFQGSFGVAYGSVEVAQLMIGGLLLANVEELLFFFGGLGSLLTACGLYLTIAGAVARGIQLSRR